MVSLHADPAVEKALLFSALLISHIVRDLSSAALRAFLDNDLTCVAEATTKKLTGCKRKPQNFLIPLKEIANEHKLANDFLQFHKLKDWNTKILSELV